MRTMTPDAGRRTVLTCRPRYESSNIRTWVGFRQLMLLAEEAVLQWFRDRDLGPQRLYHEHGLGLEVIDSSVQLPAVVEVDDEVVAEAAEEAPGRFSVALRVRRDGVPILVLRGRVTVALVRAPGEPADRPVPREVADIVVDSVAAAGPPGHLGKRRVGPGEDARSALAAGGAFVWSWRAPYFVCHFSDRVQHSGYVRALEEVVDRFLADRGLSIRTMLTEHGWIPVVSRARVQLVAGARMEEVVHTAFAVQEVLRRIAFDARMDCYVRRGRCLVPVATARILHGYARSRGERAGGLVELDEPTICALTGRIEA